MGFLIDEKTFINENIFKFEERMSSQYNRFLEKNPTFVTYYNINNNESTADSGLGGVEQILGENSPLRFNRVLDFPIYGIDSILLDLSEDEEGLTTTYESEAVILPNTLKPYPNDFFTVTYMNKDYLFMVTTVSYDYIKSNNFYKVNFTIRSLTPDQVTQLELQTQDYFNCIFRNIGTEDKCIIRTEDFDKIVKLNNVYKKLVNRYKVVFYSRKYNSFIFKKEDLSGDLIYDNFLTHFIDSNLLFNEKFNYNTMHLEIEDTYDLFEMDYDYSIFRTIELCDISLLPDQLIYTTKPITYPNSIFHYYMQPTYSIIFKTCQYNYDYLSTNLIFRIKMNQPLVGDTILRKMLIDYLNKNVDSLSGIDITALDNLSTYFFYDNETFRLVPMILYILKQYYLGFMKTNN